MDGVLCIDKPTGMTSFDVVARVRRMTGERSVGHGGTLDPMATGVLPVFLGRATKLSALYTDEDKSYRATFLFGVATDTQDMTGRARTYRPLPDLTLGALRDTLASFEGAQQQRPPMYSAVKQGGRKLYELARKGLEVERTARDVTIHRIGLLSYDPFEGECVIDVDCSKGTYIRTLVHDIGLRLGCGAALDALRRTRTLSFTLEAATPLDELEREAKEGTLTARLIAPGDALPHLLAVHLDKEQTRRFEHGQAFDCTQPPGLCRVYGAGGAFLGMGRVEDGQMHTHKLLYREDAI